MYLSLSYCLATFGPRYCCNIRHDTSQFCVMSRELHSCILLTFCKSGDEIETQMHKKSDSLMSRMNHYSLFSLLLLEEVIRSLAKERGMSESNSPLASGKLLYLAPGMINTKRKRKIQNNLTQGIYSMLMSLVW